MSTDRRRNKTIATNPEACALNQSWSLSRIVSGGQTGVDRAGLDAAIAMGIAHGGWCPAGRLAEDGSIPSRYSLIETESAEYPVRTERNVLDSDATLILYEQQLRGGTSLTRRYCSQWQKPYLLIRLARHPTSDLPEWLPGNPLTPPLSPAKPGARGQDVPLRGPDRSISRGAEWFHQVRPATLNVAGPRESSCPGIYERSLAWLLTVLSDIVS